jgi:alpha-tubulin suppressor-like RCC1 family protein
VAYLSGIVQISLGNTGACALSGSGNVYCWGHNYEGELGNGSRFDSTVPVEVVGLNGVGFLSGITQISPQCALSAGGNVYCWGSNSGGQLGNSSSSQNFSTAPVQVVGVYCDSTIEQFGDISGGGTSPSTLAPGYCDGNIHPYSGFLSNIAQIASNGNTSCAVSKSGNVFCWGYASLILGTTSTSSGQPVEVNGVGGISRLSGITQGSVGSASICALAGSGNVYCWGQNSFGQLGNGVIYSNPWIAPVEVVAPGGTGYLSGITQISAGYLGACALSNGGNVFCWGLNNAGQLGIGVSSPSPSSSNYNSVAPLEVVGSDGNGYLSNISQITTSGASCAISSAGNNYCWGDLVNTGISERDSNLPALFQPQ